MISTIICDSSGRRRRIVAHNKPPSTVLVQVVLVGLTVGVAALIAARYHLQASHGGQNHQVAFGNGTCPAAAETGVGSGGLWWFPAAVVDAFPARAYDACTMNDLRAIEQKPCIQHCYYQYRAPERRKKRALFDVAELSSASPAVAAAAAVDGPQVVGSDDDDNNNKTSEDDAGQHLWKALMDAIEHARLSLAESHSQMAAASRNHMGSKHTKAAAAAAKEVGEQSATFLRLDFKRAARFRRSDSPECLNCFLDVVQGFSSCTHKA